MHIRNRQERTHVQTEQDFVICSIMPDLIFSLSARRISELGCNLIVIICNHVGQIKIKTLVDRKIMLQRCITLLSVFQHVLDTNQAVFL